MRNPVRFFPVALVLVLLSSCDDDADGPLAPTAPETWEGTLRGEVEVHRDAVGSLHVTGDHLMDVVFVQGYEMARDRLFNMDWMRRFLYGERAEVFGPAYVNDDRAKRGLQMRRHSLEVLEFLREEHEEAAHVLQAFSDGVNLYITRMQEGHPDAPRPAELDRIDPAYVTPLWQPEDSVALSRGLLLSQNFQVELKLAWLLATTLMGESTVAEILPFAPLFATHILEEGPSDHDAIAFLAPDNGARAMRLPPLVTWTNTAADRLVERALVELVETLGRLRGQDVMGASGGSNAWAIAGERTESGHAMLCNDTHMDMRLPSTLYPVYLHVRGPGGFRAMGYGAPGFPLLAIGHTEHVAWGLTNPFADTNDFFRLEPLRGNTYRYRGEDRELVAYEEVIRVRNLEGGMDDIEERTITVRHAPDFGPLLSDLLPPEVGGILQASGFRLAVRWSGFETDVGDYPAFLRVLRARNMDQALESLRTFNGGAIQWTLADVEGRIAAFAAGRFPIRAQGVRPYAPARGDGSEDWQGFAAWEDVPRLVDPAKGYTVAANNALNTGPFDNLPEETDFYFHHFADLGTRAARLTGLIEDAMAEGPLDFDRVRSWQADTYSMHADVFLPLLEEATAAVCPDEAWCALRGDVLAWDRFQSADSHASSIFNAWMHRFFFRFYREHVPSLLLPTLGNDLPNVGGRSIGNWIQGRAPVSGRDWFTAWEDEAGDGLHQLVRLTFAQAIEDLTAFHGADVDPTTWRWADLHQAVHRHRVDEWDDFHVGPLPNDGGFRTVNAADFRLVAPDGGLAPFPYEQYESAQIRYCVHLVPGAFEVWGQIMGGASGHVESPHYTDQLDDWIANRPFPRPFSDQGVREAATRTSVLPAGTGLAPAPAP